MIPMTVREIAAAVGGSTHSVNPGASVTSVVIDSRNAAAGSMFAAIPGERVDGHDFAAAALAAGAVVVLAMRELDVPCIVVDDTILALGRLAAEARQRLSCPVIAITGSSGKTSTKDLLAQVLETDGQTIAPTGSMNNEVGCPLTILQADAHTDYLVLEMGMRGLGHIAYLCEIARPTVGVMLNIGTAHIGVVGSQDAIAQAKGEIIEGLPAEGIAVLNGDDHRVMAQAARTQARIVTFGEGVDCDARATDVRLDAGARASFTLHWGDQAEPVQLQVAGEHQVSNALAVAAVARSLGLTIEQVAMGLRAASPRSRWRMEVIETPGDITVINDAYNANPESMRAALRTAWSMAAGRRTWAVLGEMRELGERSAADHAEIGRLAHDLGMRIVSVGSASIVDAARAAGAPEDRVLLVPDADAAIAVLRGAAVPGDVILVKASRSIGLERVALALVGDDESVGDA